MKFVFKISIRLCVSTLQRQLFPILLFLWQQYFSSNPCNLFAWNAVSCDSSWVQRVVFNITTPCSPNLVDCCFCPEMVKRDIPKLVKGDEPESVKGDNMESFKGDRPELAKGDSPELAKRDSPELAKTDRLESAKADALELAKTYRPELAQRNGPESV